MSRFDQTVLFAPSARPRVIRGPKLIGVLLSSASTFQCTFDQLQSQNENMRWIFLILEIIVIFLFNTQNTSQTETSDTEGMAYFIEGEESDPWLSISSTTWDQSENARNKRQLFDVGLCVSSTASCIALSQCRIMNELVDRQCLAAGRLRDMTCGYSNSSREPLVCCPSIETAISNGGNGNSGSNDYADDNEDYGADSGVGSVLLPSSTACGVPQLITGTPPRTDQQAGPTRIGAHPWVARIGYRNLNSGVVEFVCSGAIISEKAVLTAAHCLSARGPGFQLTVVRVGEYDTGGDPDCSTSVCAFPVRDIAVNKATPHPNFDSTSFRNDIAVITLRVTLNFTINVQPICVLTRASAALIGRRALVVGWGRLASQQRVQNQQQALEVPVLQPDRCQRFYIAQYAGAQDQRVCAGGEPGRDLCAGFSGAPLMVRAGGIGSYFLIGVRAFGSDQCGTLGAANVYTSVARYTAFIRNNM